MVSRKRNKDLSAGKRATPLFDLTTRRATAWRPMTIDTQRRFGFNERINDAFTKRGSEGRGEQKDGKEGRGERECVNVG